MVTLNNDLQNFYNNMNGNISSLDSRAGNLMESVNDLLKYNSEFSDSIASYYKGKARKNALQNLSDVNDTLNKISSSINEKLYTSITMSKDILNSIDELIVLKNKINNTSVSVNKEQDIKTNTEQGPEQGPEQPTESSITINNYSDIYLFNSKQTDTLNKLKTLLNIDSSLNIEKSEIGGGIIDKLDLKPGKYTEYKFTASNGLTVDYFAYIPGNIENVEGVPIHLHLWPSRKNGGPMGYYNVHGLPRILREGGTASGIVICPKLQADEVYDTKHIDALKELTDSFVNTYDCDETRISISGQGGGGQGAINFATKYPEYFSKVISLYSLDTAYNYDELGISKGRAEANLGKNDITLIKCTGGGKNLDARSQKYTAELYNSLKDCTNVDIYNKPHYIYGDDLFSKTFTYQGKSYSNLLDYCFSKQNSNKT